MISIFLTDATSPIKQCLIVVCLEMTEWLSCGLMWFSSHCKTIICVLYMFVTNHCNNRILVIVIVRSLCTSMDNA